MKKEIISFFSFAMVVCLFICGISIVFDPRDMSFNQEKVTFVTDGWFYSLEDGQMKAFKAPMKIQTTKEKPLEIHKTFHKSIPLGNSLGFRSSQQEIHVYLDDTEIYSYEKVEVVPTLPKSPASAWHIIELPEIHSGQVLKVTSVSPYKDYHGIVNEFMISSKSAIIFQIANEYFPTLFTSILVLALGVALTFYGVHIYRIRHSANFIYLGLFALLLGTWFFGESKYIQFFLGKVLLPYQMVFLSLALMPIPALLFFNNVLQPKSQRPYEVLCLVSITNFFAMVIAQTLGLIDFYQWVRLSHSIIFLDMLLVIWSMTEFIRTNTYKRAKFLLLGFGVFFIMGMINLFFFYIMYQNDDTLFLQIGTLLALIIIAKGEIEKNLELIQVGFEAAAFKKAAYTDSLTQIGNRYAFDLVLEEVAHKEPKDNIDNAICIIDVDGLKFANDTYGHWMGDQLICSMAKCLKSVFYGRGQCFRIGGDEFAVILRGDRPQLRGYLNNLKEEIMLNNMNCQCILSASWGMAFQTDTDENCIYETLQMADALMYLDKERKKERSNTVKGFRINSNKGV